MFNGPILSLVFNGPISSLVSVCAVPRGGEGSKLKLLFRGSPGGGAVLTMAERQV